jgi:hypothetical protein
MSILLFLSVSLTGASCCLLAESAAVGPGQARGVVQDARLTEISGLAASRCQPGILWVHNDSGDRAVVYALSPTGGLLATCRIRGAQARDWEDIALGPGPVPRQSYLYIGDIGDNGARRSAVQVYRVPEPRVPLEGIPSVLDSEPCETIVLVYPDGPHDAETLMVDPRNGDLYLVTKRQLFVRVYRARAPLDTQQQVPLEMVTLLPWGLATGGDIAPDGDQVVIRGPSQAMIWQIPAEGPLWLNLRKIGQQVLLESEPQGEAVCFSGDGQSLITLSEGQSPTLYQYLLRDTDTGENSRQGR